MKKLTTLWTVIGILVTLCAIGAAVYFWFRKKAEKAAAEDFDAQVDAAAEPAQAEAQTA